MKLRVARKIRDNWLLAWKRWQVWHKFQPSTIEEAKQIHSTLHSILFRGDSTPYIAPPMTKEEKRLLRTSVADYHASQINRAMRKLPSRERVEWYVSYVEAGVLLKMSALSPWERVAQTSIGVYNVLPLILDFVSGEEFHKLPEPPPSWGG